MCRGQNGASNGASHEAIPTIVKAENEIVPPSNNGIEASKKPNITTLNPDNLVVSSPNKSELVLTTDDVLIDDKINIHLPSPGEASTKTVSTGDFFGEWNKVTPPLQVCLCCTGL